MGEHRPPGFVACRLCHHMIRHALMSNTCLQGRMTSVAWLRRTPAKRIPGISKQINRVAWLRNPGLQIRVRSEL